MAQPEELWWNNTWYKKYGSYKTLTEAKEIKKQLRRQGFSPMIKISNEYGVSKYAVFVG